MIKARDTKLVQQFGRKTSVITGKYQWQGTGKETGYEATFWSEVAGFSERWTDFKFHKHEEYIAHGFFFFENGTTHK